MTKIAAVAAVAAVVVALVASFAAGGVYLYSKSSEVDRLRKQYNDLTEKNRNIAAMAKRVETVDGWVRGGRNWLDQWAFLSGVFPSCTDCYITSIKTQTDGSISLTVKAKSSDAINELGKRLGAADYDFRPGQVTTGTDPYGYTYSTTFKVVVKSEMKVDLASLTTEPRPPDDVSAEAFGRPAAARAATTATAAAGAAPAVTYQERLKAWQLKMETFFKENPRPPDSQAEAVQAWRAKREELRNEQPKPGPPPPAPEGKRRRE
ncbi:MAG: hypothetical protein IMZ66_04610 [Planctomycetes bacterium]|nr:hypothetical protein [Planctomycetota bacterium]